MSAPDRNERLARVTGNVAEIVEAQRCEADPAHEDFYAWGGALDEMTRRLAHACRVLDGQIREYGDTRILRDDDGMDPSERVHRMRVVVRNLGVLLEQANVVARSYHQEASHLAVEADPDDDDDPPLSCPDNCSCDEFPWDDD